MRYEVQKGEDGRWDIFKTQRDGAVVFVAAFANKNDAERCRAILADCDNALRLSCWDEAAIRNRRG